MTGLEVDLNITDTDDARGYYEENEVTQITQKTKSSYVTEKEAKEESKANAPYMVIIGDDDYEIDNLPSMEDGYNSSDSDTVIYIKEGKYIGKCVGTYEEEEETENTSTENTTDNPDGSDYGVEYDGPAEYLRMILKDTDYTVIDNIEDYFDIPEVAEETTSSGTGIYADLEAIDENSSDAEKVRAAMSYFIEQGFTEEAAAGILGNLIQESALDPTADNGSHYGLGQWDYNGANRWGTVSDWMISMGYNTDSFAGQVRAIYESPDASHMSSDRWEELKGLDNVDQAVELWAIYWEGCSGGSDSPEYYETGSTKYQELTKRKRFAQNALDIYHGEDKGIKD